MSSKNATINAKVKARLSRKRTTFAVLGFLSSSPKSGYDIKRAISNSTAFFWNESFGQIYPILRELEQEGLITRGATESTGRRTKQKYKITAAGLELLRQWIADPSDDLVVRSELLLKLFFGRHVAPEVLIEHLRNHRQALEKNLRIYKQYRDEHRTAFASGKHPNAKFILAPLEHGIRSSTASIEWCDETIALLKKK